MATKEEMLEEIKEMRIQMDCKSCHCAGCPYLVNHSCELEESVFMAGVDY